MRPNKKIAAAAALIGAMGLSGCSFDAIFNMGQCVYGPPPDYEEQQPSATDFDPSLNVEEDVYGPPPMDDEPDITTTAPDDFDPSMNNEQCVYGPHYMFEDGLWELIQKFEAEYEGDNVYEMVDAVSNAYFGEYGGDLMDAVKEAVDNGVFTVEVLEACADAAGVEYYKPAEEVPGDTAAATTATVATDVTEPVENEPAPEPESEEIVLGEDEVQQTEEEEMLPPPDEPKLPEPIFDPSLNIEVSVYGPPEMFE